MNEFATSSILVRAAAIFDSPGTHCRGGDAADRLGGSVDPTNPNAVRFSLAGALIRACDTDFGGGGSTALARALDAVSATATVADWRTADRRRQDQFWPRRFNDAADGVLVRAALLAAIDAADS